jgi:hypothetical protein
MDWWRAYHGIATDPKYQVVLRHIASHRVTSRHPESLEIRLSDVAAIWVWLLDFASQSSPRGSIEGVQIDHISVATGLPDKDVETVIDGFRWRKMISGNLLTNFDKRQPSSTLRMQEKRERDSASHGVTSRHDASQGVTPLARDARSKSYSSSISEESSVNGRSLKTEESKNGTYGNYKSDESFSHFVLAATRFWGSDLIEEDLSQAWMFSWKKFDFEQKLDATKRLQARIEAGEDCRFVTRLPKYLENGAWKRPPRKPQANGRTPTEDQKSKYQVIQPLQPPED